MKNLLLTLLASLALNMSLHGQGMTYAVQDLVFNKVSYDVFMVKIDSATINRFDILENKNQLPHSEFIGSVLNDSTAFTINASISDSVCNPVGYFVKNAMQIKSANMGDGNGNFYLKPNGALLFTANDAIICESAQISKYNGIRLGIQSGPMLLDNGAVNQQFTPNSKNKNIRCGVGISIKNNGRYLLFCISNEPVTFYDFSMLFKQEYKCKDALCLESAGCAMNIPYLSSATEKFPGTICNYIVFR